MSENGEREKILRRIREALTNPAPQPGSHGHKPHSTYAVIFQPTERTL